MDVFDFRKTTTPKGIPVYYKSLPWAQSWTEIRLVMRPGAICDPPGKEGVTHLLEHLFEKENRKLPCGRTVKQVDDDFLLGTLNACTGLDYVSVVCNCLAKNTRLALPMIGELVVPYTINNDDIAAEKRIVIQEWRGSDEDKKVNRVLNDIFHNDLYRDHWMTRLNTYGGTSATMRRITRADIYERRRSLYNAANFSLLLVGHIPRDLPDALREFDKVVRFSDTQPALPSMGQLPLPARARREISRAKLFGKAYTDTQTHIRIARIVPIPPNLKLLHIADEMLEKLIYAAIRGHLSACYKFQVNHTLEADHCYFDVDGFIDPKETRHVLAAIDACLAVLRTEESRDLFITAQKQIVEKIPLMDYNVSDIADMATEHVVYENRVIPVAEKIRNAKRITFDEILRFFREDLAPEKLYWFIVRP